MAGANTGLGFSTMEGEVAEKGRRRFARDPKSSPPQPSSARMEVPNCWKALKSFISLLSQNPRESSGRCHSIAISVKY